MSAYGSVPLSRLDVLPVGTSLEKDLTLGVEHMKMNHRVKEFAAAMTFATGG